MRPRSSDAASNDRARSADTSKRDGDLLNTSNSQGKETKTLTVDVSSDGRSSARSSMDATHRSGELSPARKTSKSLNRPSPTVAAQDAAGSKDKDVKTEIMGSISTKRRRTRSAWYCSPLTFLVAALAAILTLAIFRSFTTRQLDPVGCSMSYMRPVFDKLSDFDTEHTRFATKYSLYKYREGGLDQDTRVKGVPVLFIPGNAGSYKQVRPLAAEAAVYYHDVLQHDDQARTAGKRPLDFFSVDFNEDITAFHGQTLLDQAEYLNEAISYILSLYHNPDRSVRDSGLPDPTSVMVVGHSMGGIVARTMLTLPNYQLNSINTIITLAAPHARPPISFDSDIVNTYKRINDYWRESYSQQYANNNPLWHVTLIAMAGGSLDTVVPSDYSALSSLVPPTHGFTVFTSTIPEVWTGMDHLAITWCNQLRKSVVRSLYDVIDVNRPTQTLGRADRMSAFKKRFLTGMEDFAERTLPRKQAKTMLTLEDDSNTVAHGDRLVVRALGRSGRGSPYLLPIPAASLERKVFTLLTDQGLSENGGPGLLEVLFCSISSNNGGHDAVDLDLASNGSTSTRLNCKNAASDTILLPASTKDNRLPFENYWDKDFNVLVGRSPPFSYLQYDLKMLGEHQFVAIIDKAPHAMSGWLIAEFSNRADNQVQTDKDLSTMISSGVDVTLPDRLMTEVKIPSVHSSLLSYRMSINKAPCLDGEELFRPLLRQYISDPYESKWFVNAREVDVSMHSIAPYMPPALKANGENQGLTLQLWTDPTCNSTTEVSMKVDLVGSMGKLWMRYRTVFAAFPLLVVALVLRKQFQVHDRTGSFISFSESMDLCLRSSIPMLLLALTLLGVSYPRAPQSSPSLQGFLGGNVSVTEAIIDFTRNDLLLGSQDPFFAFLVPLFGIVSVGICIMLNYMTLTITHLLAMVLSQLHKILSRNTDRSNSSLAVTPIKRRLVMTSALLLLVSTVIPYQFVYIVLCVVQLATCIRALSLARDTYLVSNFHFYNYAHSIFILMLWVLPINIPTLVVWVHNLAVHWLTPFSSHHNVLSILPYMLLVETLSTGRMIPRINTWVRHITSLMFFGLALSAAVYGVTYAYLLHHIVNVLCVWLIGVHLSASGIDVTGLMKNASAMMTSRKENSKKQP